MGQKVVNKNKYWNDLDNENIFRFIDNNQICTVMHL